MRSLIWLSIKICLVACVVFLSDIAKAQINYSTSFSGCEYIITCEEWKIRGGFMPDFRSSNGNGYFPCNNSSARANIYDGNSIARLWSTRALGISTGKPATLSFNGKAINWTGELDPPSASAATADACTFTAYWATTKDGPWNEISSLNNLSSTDCKSYTFVEFTPTSGEWVFIKIEAQRNSGDFWAVFDDISLVQDDGDDPILSIEPSEINFGYVENNSSEVETFNISGINLGAGPITISAPNGYTVSTDGITFSNSLQISYSAPTLNVTTIHLRFSPTGNHANYNDNIQNSGGGVSINLPLVGTSVPCNCDSYFDYSYMEYITNVELKEISNSSGHVYNYPADYTDLEATVFREETYEITVSVYIAQTFGDHYIYAFIDWNQNGALNDLGEIYEIASGSLSSGNYSKSILVPTDAPYGGIRMRVMVADIELSGNRNNPCVVLNDEGGEAEDYTIIVKSEDTTPIELYLFQAKCKDDNNIKISWTTASEINNDFFILEKSANALDFEKIAKIEGAGNSSTMLNYQYIDNMPYSGDNYYRLTQVDYDGTSETFNIIHANCDNANSVTKISVYPTVFDSFVKVYIENFKDNKLTFEIYDLQGRLVYKQISKNNEITYENILDLSKIKSGTYVLKVFSEALLYSTRIVKL